MSTATLTSVRRHHPLLVGGAMEVALVLGLWIAYSLSRLLADTDLVPARARAVSLLAIERRLGLDWEGPLNRFFADHGALGVVSSYWYASLHYVATAGVLFWLFRRGSRVYLPARRALALATVLALVAYLLLPTAPPRITPDFVDVLHTFAAKGWWSADASAPRGLGGFTNELAAFPSLHAGWALWVALALHRHTGRIWWRIVGWGYALGTALVVVGTGNHWVLDVLGGWLVVLLAWTLADTLPGDASVNSRWPSPEDRNTGATGSLNGP